MDAMRFADCILVSEKSALTLSIENCVPRSESEVDLVKSSNVCYSDVEVVAGPWRGVPARRLHLLEDGVYSLSRRFIDVECAKKN